MNYPPFPHPDDDEEEEPIGTPLDPVRIKGFSVTYERKFNLGNFESLTSAITIWVRTLPLEKEALNLHDCKRRVRQMARENVRAQRQLLIGREEIAFLGVTPPADGESDPIWVRTVSVSLTYKVNLGDYNSITPAYTDWADVRRVGQSSGKLHIALNRMWSSLWANIQEEIGRARGQGESHAFLGLPVIEVEDLVGSNGHPR